MVRFYLVMKTMKILMDLEAHEEGLQGFYPKSTSIQKNSLEKLK
jgi:hypothetical protein